MNEPNNTARTQGVFGLAEITHGRLSQPVLFGEDCEVICTFPALANVGGKVNVRASEIAANAKLLSAAPELEDFAHAFIQACTTGGMIYKLSSLRGLAERAIMKSKGIAL